MEHDFTSDALTDDDVWWFTQHQHLVLTVTRCRRCGLYRIDVGTLLSSKRLYKRSLTSYNPFRTWKEPPPCI